MTRVYDEEFVFHVRERLVVHDLVEETLRCFEGQSLDCGCPSIERGGVEGIWE
jgi:hypothetical protein